MPGRAGHRAVALRRNIRAMFRNHKRADARGECKVTRKQDLGQRANKVQRGLQRKTQRGYSGTYCVGRKKGPATGVRCCWEVRMRLAKVPIGFSNEEVLSNFGEVLEARWRW